MVDFHTHILPKMDDGSRGTEESLKMLKLCASQGIDTVMLTSHYYAEQESPDEFLKRRKASWERLQEAIGESGETGFPELYPGAEVKLFYGISGVEQLQRLDLAGTGFILLEMPFSEWSDKVFRELRSIISQGMHPIIAHVERYLKIQQNTDNIERLMDMDVLIQANAEFFLEGFFNKRRALHMLQEGNIHLLGSDCHNLTSRPPNLGDAVQLIRGKLGEDCIDRIVRRGHRILQNAQIE